MISFLKRHSRSIDSIGGIMWFFMDFLWMLEIYNLALVVFCIAGLCLYLGGVIFNQRDRGNYLADIATSFWFLMNSVWMITDIMDSNKYLWVSCILFTFGIIFLISSLVVSDMDKKRFDFRRFKNDLDE